MYRFGPARSRDTGHRIHIHPPVSGFAVSPIHFGSFAVENPPVSTLFAVYEESGETSCLSKQYVPASGNWCTNPILQTQTVETGGQSVSAENRWTAPKESEKK